MGLPQTVGSLPWQPDRLLDASVARSAIRGAFPSVDVSEISPVGSGWEFDVFATADRWAFRFPRRAEYQPLFHRERPALSLARSALSSETLVPFVELHGGPSESFPYKFAGHRLIEGVAADLVSVGLRPKLAETLGQALGLLHAVSPAVARAAGVIDPGDPVPPGDGVKEWFRQNLGAATRLTGSDPTIDRAISWVSGLDDPLRSVEAPVRFVHHDLGPEHLVVDPATGRLVGILDWTAAFLGDAAGDFVSSVTFGGWRFAEQVLSHYPCVLDSGFLVRLRFSAQLLSVMWLGEAVQFRGNVEKHITWVRNAFAGPSAS